MKPKKSTKQKKKPINDLSKSSGIRKPKKEKNVKKIKNSKKDLILETLKEDVNESQGTKKPIPNRQLVWNSYLRVFSEVEKLNKKQKQIMEFCMNKSRTPPKRKRKFLNFIRHSFPNQADVTDEQVNELFDLLLKKYDDFKSGKYSSVSAKLGENSDHVTKPKLSVNKKKKLKRAAEKALLNNTNEENTEDKTTKKKLKRAAEKALSSNTNEENTEDNKTGFEVVRRKKRSKMAKMEVEEENHD